MLVPFGIETTVGKNLVNTLRYIIVSLGHMKRFKKGYKLGFLPGELVEG